MKNLILILLIPLTNLTVNSQSVSIISDSTIKDRGYNTTFLVTDARIEGDSLWLKVCVPKITSIKYSDRQKVLYASSSIQKTNPIQIRTWLHISGDGRDRLSSVFADYDLYFDIRQLRQKEQISCLLV